ncbi:MAG: helix-turn-helix domain-containing protein [Bacillota bacterium]
MTRPRFRWTSLRLSKLLGFERKGGSHNESSRETNKNVKRFSEEAIRILETYDWPGNVRELKNVVERAVILAEGDIITGTYLQLPRQVRRRSDTEDALEEEGVSMVQGGIPLDKVLKRIERRLIRDALQSSGNVKAQAARLLGISQRMLRYKVARYGLDREIM